MKNKQVIDNIAVELDKLFAPEGINCKKLINIDNRHNSFILLFEMSKKPCVYVKIFKKSNTSDLSKAVNDKHSNNQACHEYNSLLWFEKNLNLFQNINTLKPLAYLPEFNAIVSREITGFELYKNLHYTNIEQTLFSIGLWLYEFHQKKRCESKLVSQADSFLENIEIEYQVIMQTSYTPQNISFGIGLGNFDIRDVLINEDNIYLLDLNTTSNTVPHLQDVGRFLYSLELAYWGTAKFGFKTVPKELGNAFLDGYFDRQKSDELRKTAYWFAARNLFKHITRNNNRSRNASKIYLRYYSQLFAKPYLMKIVKNWLSK